MFIGNEDVTLNEGQYRVRVKGQIFGCSRDCYKRYKEKMEGLG
jgi:hypothetical protein